MPEYLHPGVYVQEVPAAVKPIEGASTSTAGFVGVADKGPVPGFEMPFGDPPRPPLVTSFAEYTRIFGSYRRDSFLTYSVQNFFDNGGKRAYIVRVAVTDDPPQSVATAPATNARLAAVGLLNRESTPVATLGLIAATPGSWANRLGVLVTDATNEPTRRFKLTVLQDGVPVEAFDDLSMDPEAEGFVDTVINSRSELILARGIMPFGVGPEDSRPQTTDLHSVRLLGDGAAPALDVSSPVYLGGPLTIRTSRTGGTTTPTFRLLVLQNGGIVEEFDGLSMDPALGSFVERKINGISDLIAVEVPPASPPITDYAAARPVDLDVAFPTVALPAGSGYDAGPGLDGRTPSGGDLLYLGASDRGSGLRAFDKITDVNIIAIPGQGNDLVISGAMAYCKNRPLQDAFFVADLGLLSPSDARVPRHDAGPQRQERRARLRARPLHPERLRRALLPVDPGGRPDRARSQSHDRAAAVGLRGRSLRPDRQQPRRLQGARGDGGRSRRGARPDGRHPGRRPGQPEPDRPQRDPARSRQRDRHVGHPDPEHRGPGLALHPRQTDGDLPAHQHLLRHPVGGVRAQRRAAVGAAAAERHARSCSRSSGPAPSRARRRATPSSSSATPRRPRSRTSTTASSTSSSASLRSSRPSSSSSGSARK